LEPPGQAKCRFAWAGSYLTGRDYFGVPERFCRATPQLQLVGGNCDTFGGVVGCASRGAASARKRVRRPISRSAIERLQGSKRVRRLVRRNLPAPPSGTLPGVDPAGVVTSGRWD
jgi:hypothetical protein